MGLVDATLEDLVDAGCIELGGEGLGGDQVRPKSENFWYALRSTKQKAWRFITTVFVS